jgi:RING-variant domain
MPASQGELSRTGTEDIKKCRIGRMASTENYHETIDFDPLIRPCLCKGSMAYVHLQCLQRWRKESFKNQFTCEVCHYQYNLQRPFWANVIGSPFLKIFITIVFVLAIIVVLSYLVKVIDVYVIHHYPNPQDYNWLSWHGTTVIMWLDRFYVFVGVCLTAFLGLVYMIVSVVTKPSGSLPRTIPLSACFGPMDYGAAILIVIVLFGIVAAVTGVFQFVHNLLSKLLNRAQERILEVTEA